MNPEARRELDLLEALSNDAQLTQRRLAGRLGIALGLTNLYLKRMVRKGYVKCVNGRSNRLLYVITPSGIAEKTRLTYEFMEYSLRLYRGARGRVRTLLEPLAHQQSIRVAIYGAGEAAELTYLCLKELNVQPTVVFSIDGAGETFLNTPVLPISDHTRVPFDILIVATLDKPAPLVDELASHGVAREKLLLLRDP
jgi:DNA-binding MarR family transcriptional regulator